MTEEEIKAIETHTEIHAKAEPRAIKITEILRKAVKELRRNRHLEEEMEVMTSFCGACKKEHEEQLERAKEIIRELVDNQLMIRVHNPYADEKTNEMLESVLERWFKKAEQFLKENK